MDYSRVPRALNYYLANLFGKQQLTKPSSSKGDGAFLLYYGLGEGFFSASRS